MNTPFQTRLIAAALVAVTLSSMAATPAEARRGGSFGSRGSRTYYAPRTPYGANRAVPPIERSMTPGTATPAPSGYNPGFSQSQPYRATGNRFGGIGGGLLGGLIAGGLIGHFLGGGMGGSWGGGSGGMLATFLQIAIVGGIVWLVIGFFRRRSGAPVNPMREPFGRTSGFNSSPTPGSWGSVSSDPQGYSTDGMEIALTPRDQQDFERLLVDIQDAFGREDYARLRTLTTPEIMSYLAEELSQNATRGVRNEVTSTRLVDAEVAEAWRETSGDYATIMLRYMSIDVMRDRTTGAVVAGSPVTPSETTELWTFVRGLDGLWRLSAIQES